MACLLCDSMGGRNRGLPIAHVCPWGAVCLLDHRSPPTRPMLLTYAGLVLGFQAAAWSSVIWLLTWSRIHDTLLYQSSIAGSFDLIKKLSLVVDICSQNVAFTIAAVAAILIGVFRARLNPSIASIAMVALFIALFLIPSALFVRSHDAVVIAALTGLGLLAGLRRREALGARVLATIYAVSLTAGLATAATATYGLFSFPVGGLFAAIIAVLPQSRQPGGSWVGVPGAAFLGLLLWASATFYYGERASETPQRREAITAGVYAGLDASEETAQLISDCPSSAWKMVGRRRNDSSGRAYFRVVLAHRCPPAGINSVPADDVSAAKRTGRDIRVLC